MPFASLPKGQAVPLNLPDCFKRAVPFLDCSWRSDHYYGGVTSQGERDQNRKIGQAIDKVARRQIQTMRGRIVRPHDSNCGERVNAFDIQVDGRSICVILETVLLSESLPLGYGYALAPPEGNDPEVEKVNLQTYGKKAGSFQSGTTRANNAAAVYNMLVGEGGTCALSRCVPVVGGTGRSGDQPQHRAALVFSNPGGRRGRSIAKINTGSGPCDCGLPSAGGYFADARRRAAASGGSVY
jgi:hypothetical protein